MHVYSEKKQTIPKIYWLAIWDKNIIFNKNELLFHKEKSTWG